jgi:DNA end-binding protein Ku
VGEAEEQGGRPRAIWSGTISFGLLSLPVELFPANRRRAVSLRMLDAEGRPLSRKYYCPRHDEPVPNEEVVRAYPLDGEQYVVMTDEELASAAPEKSREIDLRRFVGVEEIDPLYFRRAYFLTPAKGASKAYRLLAHTMERVNRAGIATFVMRGKEYLVALLAEDGILRAETLRFEDELRSPSTIGLPELRAPDESRLKAYRKSIRDLSRDDLPEQWLADGQMERLRALIERKQEEGKDVVDAGALAEEEAAAEVIDLMQVLKERLRADDGGGRRGPERSRARGSASRRGRARRESSNDALGKAGLSKDALYEEAKALDIPGRSKMDKAKLIEAIERAR